MSGRVALLSTSSFYGAADCGLCPQMIVRFVVMNVIVTEVREVVYVRFPGLDMVVLFVTKTCCLLILLRVSSR